MNDKDKRWIQGEIQAAETRIAESISAQVAIAVESFKPKGWKKAVAVLRELGPLVATIGIFVALFGITLSALYQAFSHVKEETEFRTSTKDKLNKLDTDVVSLRALISSNQPLKIQNQQAAKELILEARKKVIPAIPDEVVNQAGQSFVEASITESRAWDVALEFLSYRTLTNKASVAVGTAEQIATTPVTSLATYYDLSFINGKSLPRITVGGEVPSGEAATMHYLSRPDPNQGNPRGKQVILIEGGAISIDNMFFKHVVIRNSEIFYSGTPINIEDVVFVNCTFVMINSSQTREFAIAVLSNGPTDFKSS